MINTSKMSTEETVQLLASFYDAKKASSHLRMPLKINMKKIISIKKVGNPTFSFT